ncbi:MULTISPECIES: glycogen debranching protein GlgX [unclassified Sphingomonas]|uniref:glycogen debranching protein GlgX n=1 Tax=unclassified Sphingomonas TaxID=196159 RepID=UPI000929E610|nr:MULTISPECIES: glycogen debranching protein GlgX [unclassified Sphingomonas]OJU17776.1 MAG: glycogen debranching enzyme GlgX [Sphingomonas sp. 66-10]
MTYGAIAGPAGTIFRVRAPEAQSVTLCLFERDHEVRREMRREGTDWVAEAPAPPGTLYGYRAAGSFDPAQGRWFDASKLLVDPYATELDRRFAYTPSLHAFGTDTGPMVPKAIVPGDLPVVEPAPPVFTHGGLIYEANVRALTMLHPDVPEELRGTVAALAHPAIIAHLTRLHVSAIELMPIVAWIDERHLPPLGLCNAWGYNPVVPMALDPGLCPGGVAELRETVAALHAAGIGVILDLVFNHTGESDVLGPTLSFRGLDNQGVYAHDREGRLINDTGCGNTLNFGEPYVRELARATLRHFVRHCGIDGFRFDLAPVMARSPGFQADAPIFAEIAADPILADRVLIAEPWDPGPGGYQLGAFPENWLEWNDRFRDDVRRFWRGDGTVGTLATRLAGSSDLFGPHSRSVNFIAAHDGMTLADTVAYAGRHNWANGEENRDGQGDNASWNNGVEGPSDDPNVVAHRAADARALLGTLFASTGSIMLTAGDEFGRTQLGNNNAYCQDNHLTWLDWGTRDRLLEDHVAALAQWRAARAGWFATFPRQGDWLSPSGQPMTIAEWEDPATSGLTYRSLDSDRPYSIDIDRIGRRVGTSA